MSIGFSVVLYEVSARSLRPHGPRPVPTQSTTDSSTANDDRPPVERDPEVEAYLQQREAEGKRALVQRLVILNLLALAMGSGLSLYLARRTLQPIEANMDAQAQFVTDASHELRTPLTALQTTNEVALRRPNLTASDARELLQHNVAEVAKLQALTTSLLNLAKQDAHVQLSPVLLQDIAADAMNSVVSTAQQRHIAIDDAVPNIRALANAQNLAQVIVILLDNAIKYSPAGTKVTISGTISGKYASIAVADNGQGIAAVDLPHIFDRFYRADQSRTRGKVTQHADGYGIGLSLAQKLVRQMNGTISVTSLEGKGSTFTVRLPVAVTKP